MLCEDETMLLVGTVHQKGAKKYLGG